MTVSEAVETTFGVIAGIIGVCGFVAGVLLGVYLTMGIDLCGAGTACNSEEGLGVIFAVFGVWLATAVVVAAVVGVGYLLSKAWQKLLGHSSAP